MDSQTQEAIEWTRCIAGGTLAEIGAQDVYKGSYVYVADRLHTLRWNDAETGERQARVEIVLDDRILLDRQGGDSGAAAGEDEAVSFSTQGGWVPWFRPGV